MIRGFPFTALIVFFCAIGGPSGHCQSHLPMPEELQQRLQAAWEKARNDPTVRSLQKAKDALDDQLENAVSAAMRATDPSLAPIVVGPAARDFVFHESLTSGQKELLETDQMAPKGDPAVREKLRDVQAEVARLEARIEEMRERDVAKEEQEQARNAYQTVVDKLAKVDLDDRTASAAIYELKSEADQHLDSETIHELFGPVERRLEQNHKRLADQFAATALASPEIDSATGLVDWEATSKKAYAPLQRSEPGKSSLLSMPLASLAAISLLAAIAIRLFQPRRLAAVEEIEETVNFPSYSTICPHCDWSHSQPRQPVSGAPATCNCCGKSFAPVWEKA
jgi:hypothetical protein